MAAAAAAAGVRLATTDGSGDSGRNTTVGGPERGGAGGMRLAGGVQIHDAYETHKNRFVREEATGFSAPCRGCHY